MSYPVTALPPSLTGGDQATSAEAAPAVALGASGVPGAVDWGTVVVVVPPPPVVVVPAGSPKKFPQAAQRLAAATGRSSVAAQRWSKAAP